MAVKSCLTYFLPKTLRACLVVSLLLRCLYTRAQGVSTARYNKKDISVHKSNSFLLRKDKVEAAREELREAAKVPKKNGKWHLIESEKGLFRCMRSGVRTPARALHCFHFFGKLFYFLLFYIFLKPLFFYFMFFCK